MEREQNMELSDLSYIERMGISGLLDWDVLAFVYRHGVSLTSADQIAWLIGYENTAIDGALDRLERAKLIERSRSSQGIQFYRILPSSDARDRCCLEAFIRLSQSRAGRLLLAKRLKTGLPGSGREAQLATPSE